MATVWRMSCPRPGTRAGGSPRMVSTTGQHSSKAPVINGMRGGGAGFSRWEGKKEISGLAQAVKRFLFLKSTVCTSEAASLCPQASSVSRCSWTWSRHSSSAASSFTSGFVALCEMWGSPCTAPFGLLIGSTAGSPSLLFPVHSSGCLGAAEWGGGSPSLECLPKDCFGADVYFVGAAGLAKGSGGNPEVVGNLQGRGLLQQPAET